MKSKSALIALAVVAGAAQAAGDDPRPFYVGTTVGVAVVSPRDRDINDDRDVDGRLSGGLFAGLRLAELPIGQGWPLFLEGGYQRINRTVAWYRTPGGDTKLATEGSSTYLATRLAWPITEHLGLHAVLGVAHNNAESKYLAGPGQIEIEDRKSVV